MNTYQAKYKEWRDSFAEIYSSAPYNHSLIENANNLLAYWECTFDFYVLNSYNLGIDILEVFKFLSTIGYIILSIILHALILTIVLPVAAIFFSTNESLSSILYELLQNSLIALQSIHFAIFDLIFQTIAFSLSIFIKPFIALYMLLFTETTPSLDPTEHEPLSNVP